jgi:hypothetical protein
MIKISNFKSMTCSNEISFGACSIWTFDFSQRKSYLKDFVKQQKKRKRKVEQFVKMKRKYGLN